MVRWGVLALAGVVLAGCAQQPKVVWLRTDGQLTRNNPALATQFEVDKTVCEGETQKANLSGAQFCRGFGDCLAQSIERNQGMATVARGCMAQRGYMLVPEAEAEAKAAELRVQASPPVAAAPPPAPARRR